MSVPKRRSSRRPREWNVEIQRSGAASPTKASMRERISPAALLVKVRAKIVEGGTSLSPMRKATRCAIARVFPEPAPASTSTGPSGAVTAALWRGLSSESMSGALESGLLNSHRLGQVAWLVDVATASDGNVIGEKLKRHDREQWRYGLGMRRERHEPIVLVI